MKLILLLTAVSISSSTIDEQLYSYKYKTCEQELTDDERVDELINLWAPKDITVSEALAILASPVSKFPTCEQQELF